MRYPLHSPITFTHSRSSFPFVTRILPRTNALTPDSRSHPSLTPSPRHHSKVTETSNGVLEEPVGGVLLTVSGQTDDVYDGEDTFRSNVKTYANGTRKFSGLFPGTYFIRPVLKEYEFQPAWKSVQIFEGKKPDSVHFRSVRVSFSCYGTVTTLNGVPQAGVRVLARQKDKEDAVVEETRTDQEGNFRVRGLLPESEYEFFLHGLSPVPSRASFPRSQVVRTKGHSDIRDIKFVSLVAPVKAFEIVGTVDVASEWVDKVTVTLSSVTSPGKVISRVKVSALRLVTE